MRKLRYMVWHHKYAEIDIVTIILKNKMAEGYDVTSVAEELGMKTNI